MNTLTDKDIKALKPLEIYFKQIKEGYKRATSIKEDMLVSEYYTKLTGKVEKNFACGQCSFRMYKTVGDAYWQALKENETDTTTKKNDKPTPKKTVKKNGQRRVTKEKK